MTHVDAERYVIDALAAYMTPGEIVACGQAVQRSRELAVMLHDLPPDMRTVVMLRAVQRLPWADVARRMYVTSRTAERMMLRAVDQLVGALIARRAASEQVQAQA